MGYGQEARTRDSTAILPDPSPERFTLFNIDYLFENPSSEHFTIFNTHFMDENEPIGSRAEEFVPSSASSRRRNEYRCALSFRSEESEDGERITNNAHSEADCFQFGEHSLPFATVNCDHMDRVFEPSVTRDELVRPRVEVAERRGLPGVRNRVPSSASLRLPSHDFQSKLPLLNSDNSEDRQRSPQPSRNHRRTTSRLSGTRLFDISVPSHIQVDPSFSVRSMF